jgi:hypothetical protein
VSIRTGRVPHTHVAQLKTPNPGCPACQLIRPDVVVKNPNVFAELRYGDGGRFGQVPQPGAPTCSRCGTAVTGQTPSSFYLAHDERCGGPLEEPRA